MLFILISFETNEMTYFNLIFNRIIELFIVLYFIFLFFNIIDI